MRHPHNGGGGAYLGRQPKAPRSSAWALGQNIFITQSTGTPKVVTFGHFLTHDQTPAPPPPVGESLPGHSRALRDSRGCAGWDMLLKLRCPRPAEPSCLLFTKTNTSLQFPWAFSKCMNFLTSKPKVISHHRHNMDDSTLVGMVASNEDIVAIRQDTWSVFF